jgi:hypothetical protein
VWKNGQWKIRSVSNVWNTENKTCEQTWESESMLLGELRYVARATTDPGHRKFLIRTAVTVFRGPEWVPSAASVCSSRLSWSVIAATLLFLLVIVAKSVHKFVSAKFPFAAKRVKSSPFVFRLVISLTTLTKFLWHLEFAFVAFLHFVWDGCWAYLFCMALRWFIWGFTTIHSSHLLWNTWVWK